MDERILPPNRPQRHLRCTMTVRHDGASPRRFTSVEHRVTLTRALAIIYDARGREVLRTSMKTPAMPG